MAVSISDALDLFGERDDFRIALKLMSPAQKLIRMGARLFGICLAPDRPTHAPAK